MGQHTFAFTRTGGKRARKLRRGDSLFASDKRSSVETDETSSTTTESSIEVEDKVRVVTMKMFLQ